MKITTQTEAYKENVARKIKKTYIGIGGVARPCFPGDFPEYFGTINSLTSGRRSYAAITLGDYAIFAGGTASATEANTVETYNASLTKSYPSTLSSARCYLDGAIVGDYVIFNSGAYYPSNGGTAYLRSGIDIYNSSLTKNSSTPMSHSYYHYGTASIGNYAIFAGGDDDSMSGEGEATRVTVYNSSLTRSTATALSTPTSNPSGTSIGDYALFAGGRASVDTSTVVAYNSSLTKTINIAPLLYARSQMAATSTNTYAIFAGGGYGQGARAHVDAYNSSLTRTIAPNLSEARGRLGGTTLNNYAIFAGGCIPPLQASSTYDVSMAVDIYDDNLTHTIGTSLGGAKEFLAGTTIGNYALFGPGNRSNTMDVFTYS